MTDMTPADSIALRMKHFLRPQIVLPLATLTGVVALCLAAVLYVYQKHQSVQQQLLTTIEPRYARLLGLEKNATDLTNASKQAQTLTGRYVHDSSQDSNQVGNEVQQRVRTLLAAAGMEISSSQVLPPRQEGGFDAIPLTVRAEGDLASLSSALTGLATHKPLVFIDGLSIQAQGQPAATVAQRLQVQFNFLVLQRRAQS